MSDVHRPRLIRARIPPWRQQVAAPVPRIVPPRSRSPAERPCQAERPERTSSERASASPSFATREATPSTDEPASRPATGEAKRPAPPPSPTRQGCQGRQGAWQGWRQSQQSWQDSCSGRWVEEAGRSSEPDADASSEAPSPPADELGVQPDATAEKVRAAWRQAVLQKHPDKPGCSADECRRVGEAWQVQKDPKARATYDQTRAAHG